MSNCNDKLKYTCGKITNARCVDYEGDLSNCTDLDKDCRVHTLHEVIEDVNEQLTKHCAELDMSGVDKGCLEGLDSESKLPKVLSKVIAKLCETKEGDCNLIFNTPIDCAELDYGCLVDDCGVDIAPKNLKELLQSMINQGCECCEGGGGPAVSKMYFYKEKVETKDVYSNLQVIDDKYSFINGYQELEYENTKTTPMTVEVHISYNFSKVMPGPGITSYNSLRSAIVKTVTGVDTVQYEKEGTESTRIGYVNYSTNDFFPPESIERVKTTPGGFDTSVAILDETYGNVSYFKVLTLQPSEKVSLKFGIEETVVSIISAQILVKEL